MILRPDRRLLDVCVATLVSREGGPLEPDEVRAVGSPVLEVPAAEALVDPPEAAPGAAPEPCRAFAAPVEFPGLLPALADGWLHALVIRRRSADPDEVASSLIDS